jgi:catechol 2,3-dioxygenase
VLDEGERTVGFFRSDPEHHSFGVFRCPETRPDHHACETTCWNDIRDWADHLSTLNIKLCGARAGTGQATTFSS